MPPDPADEDDASLLQEYCASLHESAFRFLVERHLPAVWGAACRIVNGDAALAEDIAQEVFAHLAVHAPKLPPRVVLGGWLHRHTCFTASKTIRAAARRRAREHQHAASMTAATADDPWPDIAPHLDAALHALPAADRDAVVLRFFEKRDFRAIAAALGTTEDAARMRTARALEKLRGLLGKRSALLTVALLTSLLAEKSIAAPAAGLTSQIVQSSLARAAIPAAGGLATLLARLRPHRAAIAGLAVLGAAGFAVWQWHGMINAPRDTSRAVVAPSSGKTKAAPADVAKTMDVTVHFILVPEAEAAALMANRWTSNADNALLSSLLQRAGPDPKGIHVARTFTGTRRSGQRSKFENIKEFRCPTEFHPGEKGMVTPVAFTFRNVGSTAEIELTVSDDDLCDVNLTAEHDYAEPLVHHFGTSLDKPEDESLPGAKQPEMRVAKTTTQLLIKPGTSQLAGCSQLPRLPDAPEAGEQRLFTFITIEPSAQP